MATTGIWPVVHEERKALAADLRAIGDAQWASASLCDGWTVRDVVAHLTASAKVTPAAFFPKLAGSGFSFTKMQAKDIAAESGASPADTLAHFEAIETATKRPPGPKTTPLGETLVHAEDVRRPLGIRHTYPSEAAVAVADAYKKSNLIIGSKRRIDGVTLRATDTDWVWGSGPEAAGPIMSLLLAMTGRKAALDDLSGEGVATLRERP